MAVFSRGTRHISSLLPQKHIHCGFYFFSTQVYPSSRFKSIQIPRKSIVCSSFCTTDTIGLNSTSVWKELNLVVSSLRVDRVAASGFGLGRRKLEGRLLAGKLYLNRKTVTKGSQQVASGDVIELLSRQNLTAEMGEPESDMLLFSRLVVASVGEKTRKGNLHLTMFRQRNVFLSQEEFMAHFSR